MKKYIINSEDNHTQQVIQHIFFCFTEQINLARRFVSGFCMQTDATFNINKLCLPLSVVIEFTNTSKTFLVTFCFITSEFTEAFKFVNTQLKKLMFYDSPGPTVIVRDFSKGHSAVMARCGGVEVVGGASEGVVVVRGGSGDVKASEKAGEGVEGCILQLCEWHAVKAIKKRLVVAGQYIKKR